jgi:hypothetical protein
MSTITADPVLGNWLGQLKDVTEIRDVGGNLLGTFTPKFSADELAGYEKAKKLFDPVETERIAREQHGQGRPLAEIWKDLEARERQT